MYVFGLAYGKQFINFNKKFDNRRHTARHVITLKNQRMPRSRYNYMYFVFVFRPLPSIM